MFGADPPAGCTDQVGWTDAGTQQPVKVDDSCCMQAGTPLPIMGVNAHVKTAASAGDTCVTLDTADFPAGVPRVFTGCSDGEPVTGGFCDDGSGTYPFATGSDWGSLTTTGGDVAACGCTSTITGAGCYRIPADAAGDGADPMFREMKATGCDGDTVVYEMSADDAISAAISSIFAGSTAIYSTAVALVSILIQFKN